MLAGVCERDREAGRPEGLGRVPLRACTRERMPGQGGLGWAESQEQGGAPPWSGLGLAAGWPGSSKPPRLNRPCLERERWEGGMLVPSQALPCPAESFLCEWSWAEKGPRGQRVLLARQHTLIPCVCHQHRLPRPPLGGRRRLPQRSARRW